MWGDPLLASTAPAFQHRGADVAVRYAAVDPA
jgi:hypothetical protein